MGLKELILGATQSGSDTFKRLADVVDKMPTDATLKEINITVSRLIPYIPQLEKMLGDGNLDKLTRIMEKVPNSYELDKLSRALMMLDRIPDKATLEKLLNKVDALENLLNTLDSAGVSPKKS